MPPRLVKLTVVQSPTIQNIAGTKNWVAVKKTADITIEATTTPNNNVEEWKQIKWSGYSGHLNDAIESSPNRRKLSLSVSKKYHVEASLGGVSGSLDVWVLWATVQILTKGPRAANAAAFDDYIRDKTQTLGAVSYESLSSSIIDEKAGVFVTNMGASGKITAVATLSPKGVNQIVKTGWSVEREVSSHNWQDGSATNGTTQGWRKDTSKPGYLRLTPDGEDKIYDTDAPDLRWGQFSSETYNLFRQWVEWNGEKCSDNAPWYWRARWVLNKDTRKQIVLNDLGTGDKPPLPDKPHFPVGQVP
jgi:hypothetical protein